MGMAASACLWYGVRAGELGPLSEDDTFYDGELAVDGVNVHPVWAYDSLIGIGGTIAHAWWGDNGTVDLSTVDAVKAAVDKFLDEHSVEGDRCVRLLANYS